MTEFITHNPKVYSINHHTLNEFNEMKIKSKKMLTGVSKVVAKTQIKHDNYGNVIETNEALNKVVVSMRSFNHQLYTFKQQKTLTSFCDKMQMIDNINCIPYGYNPSTETPPKEPKPLAEPDKENIFNDAEKMLMDEMLRPIKETTNWTN